MKIYKRKKTLSKLPILKKCSTLYKKVRIVFKRSKNTPQSIFIKINVYSPLGVSYVCSTAEATKSSVAIDPEMKNVIVLEDQVSAEILTNIFAKNNLVRLLENAKKFIFYFFDTLQKGGSCKF